MRIHYGYRNLNITDPFVTMGIFDGVHRGHKVLLECLVSRAKENKGESVVITFSPHPRLVLDQKNPDLSFLTTMEEKMILLEKANIDHLIIIEFDKHFSEVSAYDFIKDILVKKIGIKHLILGYNHRFGKKGEGDFNTLKQYSEQFGFTIEQVEGVRVEERIISSSVIRDALLKGSLEQANGWLGYYYSVSGTVIKGKKIGHSLGFPTANIKPDSQYKLIPANGVYAVEVHLGNKVTPGVMNIGSNPTVNDDKKLRSIEVHILNFEKDIYGDKISVDFRKRLRDEKKFDNLQQLTEQMIQDKKDTLRLLA